MELTSFFSFKVGQCVAEADVNGVQTSEAIGEIVEIVREDDIVFISVVDPKMPEVSNEYPFWAADGEPVPAYEDSTIGDLIYLLVV